MHATLSHTKSIPVGQTVIVGFKAFIAALALYALCFAAPAIYTTNPDVREFDRQSIIRSISSNALLARLQSDRQQVVTGAREMQSPEKRMAFVREELGRARIELEGYCQRVKLSRANVDRVNSLFHRITGNKLLKLNRQKVHEEQALLALAVHHVDQLTALLNRSHQQSRRELDQITKAQPTSIPVSRNPW